MQFWIGSDGTAITAEMGLTLRQERADHGNRAHQYAISTKESGKYPAVSSNRSCLEGKQRIGWVCVVWGVFKFALNPGELFSQQEIR